MKVIHNNQNFDPNKKVYSCCVCDKKFNWSNESTWFGSYEILEDAPHQIDFVCSRDCRDIHKLKLLKEND